MNLFRSATLRLTGWYLLLIMIVSISFSAVIYNVSSMELRRGLPPGDRFVVEDQATFEQYRQERIAQANERLVRNLVVIDLSMLGLGGGAAYFLARRTLRPIEEVMEMQGRFVSDASHELRTPLAVMQSEIEVALRNPRLDKVQMREQLESNLEEVLRLRQLSDRLLELSTTQSITLLPTTSDSLASTVLTRVMPIAEEKQITIEADVDQVSFMADEAMASDMIALFIENAVKYSPEKTTVTLGIKELGRSVRISVRDQGMGIEEKDKIHIFERFYRADVSRTSQTVKGHGLGLSIAQRIADLHHTHISVESEPGKGSTFSFVLPKAADTEPPKQ